MLGKTRKIGIEVEFSSLSTRQSWVEFIAKVGRNHGIPIYSDFGHQHGVYVDYDYHLTYDGSVNHTGLELLTRPFRLDDWDFIRSFDTLLTAIKINGGFTDRSTGLHVHVSGVGFTHVTLCKLVVLWMKYEALLYLLIPPIRRSNSSYAYDIRRYMWSKIIPVSEASNHKMYLLKYLLSQQSEAAFMGIWHDRMSRYCKLNLRCFSNNNTIEIRSQGGTLDILRIMNWATLIVHFIDYVETFPAGRLLGETSPAEWGDLSDSKLLTLLWKDSHKNEQCNFEKHKSELERFLVEIGLAHSIEYYMELAKEFAILDHGDNSEDPEDDFDEDDEANSIPAPHRVRRPVRLRFTAEELLDMGFDPDIHVSSDGTAVSQEHTDGTEVE